MANCIFTLAWVAKEACRIVRSRIGRLQRVHVIGDGVEHFCRPLAVDIDETLELDLTDWYLNASSYETVARDLFDRVRLALLRRQPVIFWNP